MSQQALLRRIVEALDGAGIPYMLTGSLVSSLQGEPRATHDIDFVVDIMAGAVARVTQALSAPEVCLDEHAVGDATRRRTVFNLIDTSSGDKADFWLRSAGRPRQAEAHASARRLPQAGALSGRITMASAGQPVEHNPQPRHSASSTSGSSSALIVMASNGQRSAQVPHCVHSS